MNKSFLSYFRDSILIFITKIFFRLMHYLRPNNHFYLISLSRYFDRNWYLSQNPDVAKSGVNPIKHYLSKGTLEGRNPSKHFNTKWYISVYNDVAAAGINPLVHYLKWGVSEGRKPVPLVTNRTDFDLKGKKNRGCSLKYRNQFSSASILSSELTIKLSEKNPAKKRLICVSHFLPYPCRAGNEYRLHKMLSWLQDEEFEIYPVICPLNDDDVCSSLLAEAYSMYPNILFLKRDGTLTHRFDGQISIHKVNLKQPHLKFNSKLPSISSNFCPNHLLDFLVELDLLVRPTVFFVNYVFMTKIFQFIRPTTLKIVDTHDVFSTKETKVLPFGIEDNSSLTSQQESELLNEADLIIAIHSQDKEILHQLVPKKQIVTVGIDFNITHPILEYIDPPVVLLVASDNACNVKGLNDFLRFSWPIITRAVPEAELRIVGSVGDSFLHSGDPSVIKFGKVESLSDFYSQARVVINPAVAGTGLKIKSVEALCHLRPLVTWPSGVDGMGNEIIRFCHVAHNWYEFACHVIKLCRDQSHMQSLLANSDIIHHKYSTKNNYQKLANCLSVFSSEAY